MRAQLSEAHVVALRWYTTESYRAINGPLRDAEHAGPHPFAATLAFIAQAIGKLRALEAPDRVGGGGGSAAAGGSSSSAAILACRWLKTVFSSSESRVITRTGTSL